KRYEIIEGELYVTPAPDTRHQKLIVRLTLAPGNEIEKNKLGHVFVAPTDVVLSMTNVVQPDLCVIASDRSRIITRANIVEAPDLVIEVLSESTVAVDRGAKKTLYEQYAVREYWIVDPRAGALEQYVLGEESLDLRGTFGQRDTLTSSVFGVTIPLEDIFRE
ncbi:MAG TPA: Uma2 family endonuclease, partial [bacterium]|nr:Uma2 family endonuclease [bacterium]